MINAKKPSAKPGLVQHDVGADELVTGADRVLNSTIFPKVVIGHPAIEPIVEQTRRPSAAPVGS